MRLAILGGTGRIGSHLVGWALDQGHSALGPRGAKAPGLLTGAAAAIAGAMEQAGTRRLISVSAAGAYITADPNMNQVVKLILPRILAKQFADVRGMEDVIRQTDPGLDAGSGDQAGQHPADRPVPGQPGLPAARGRQDLPGRRGPLHRGRANRGKLDPGRPRARLLNGARAAAHVRRACSGGTSHSRAGSAAAVPEHCQRGEDQHQHRTPGQGQAHVAG